MTAAQWWPGLAARAGRLTGRLYQWRMGWLFGRRFAVLTHEDGRSGRTLSDGPVGLPVPAG
jgi:hypothetical protein